MSEELFNLLLSDSFANVSSDEIVIYMTLRADIISNHTAIARVEKRNGFLVSGLEVQTIAQFTNLSELTIERNINSLCKRKWLKFKKLGDKQRYELGNIDLTEGVTWYVENNTEKGNPQSALEVIQQKLKTDKNVVKEKEIRGLEDSKKRITHEIFQGTGLINNKGTSKEILNLFVKKYEDKYKVECPLIENKGSNKYSATYVYIGRAIKWSKNIDEVKNVIVFMFDNWEKLSEAFGLDGRPSFNFVGSSNIWQRMVVAYLEGIPSPKKAKVDPSNRYKRDKEAKSSGW